MDLKRARLRREVAFLNALVLLIYHQVVRLTRGCRIVMIAHSELLPESLSHSKLLEGRLLTSTHLIVLLAALLDAQEPRGNVIILLFIV